MQSSPYKILIVKIAAIGDVVMSMPLLMEIRKKHPNAHITWVCGSIVASLLAASNQVDRIVPIRENKLLVGSIWSKALQLFKTWIAIGFWQRFDLVLTLHPDPRYRLISLFSLCKDRRFWGLQKDRRFYPIPGHYHAHEYLHILEPDQKGPIQTTAEFPTLQLPSLKMKKDKNKDLVILMPGGAKNILADDALRRWPIESYSRLIQQFAELQTIDIVIAGTHSDRWIESFLPKDLYQNWIDRLNLLEMIALLKNCSLLITHDSGPLHLAKLAGCPVLALFGPTNPHEKTSPEEKIKVLWGGNLLSCRPCYNGKTYAKCRENRCLSSLTPEIVFCTAIEMLNERKLKERCFVAE